MSILISDKIQPVLFGTDPEAATLYEKDGKTFALPPYFFREVLGVEASRDKKHPVFLKGDGWKVHEDGANWEMAIRPSFNPRELFDTIREAESQLSSRILSMFPEYCIPSLQFLPTVNWEVERWREMPKSFFMSTQFGCDPDEDLFNLQARSQVLDVKEHDKRYCGGHIHISHPKIASDPHMALHCMVITAGVAATAFSDVPELEYLRTFYYGRPGKFRIQNYGKDNPYGPEYQIGVEYRTVSARWAGVWEIAEQVLSWAEKGIQNLFSTSLGAELSEELSQDAVKAILNVDQNSARDILNYIDSKI